MTATARPGRLEGRVCLVTGSTGIAAASAALLAAEGGRVFITSRSADHCASLAERISADGGTAAWQAADLAVPDEVAAAIDACVDAFGRIDGLLSVAGGSGRPFGDGPIHLVTAEAWEATMRLNLTTQALVCREVVRRMLDQDPDETGSRGSIALVTSVLATHPVAELFATHAYAAAKGAILSLMTTMAAYYAGHRIRVNAIAPSLVETPMSARAKDSPAILEFVTRKQPLVGGMLAPEDIAPAAVYLLSPESRAVTGQLLTVDGGWSVVSASADRP
ncbi:MAG TPA: SDR family oxidoreductase [Candidatus Limnocylindrales bacterium]|nr:SDR family oxidoreductase [Candidatus Limnocylindrales bacterium]